MEKDMETVYTRTTGNQDDSLGSEMFFEEFANIKNKVKFEGRILDIDASLCEKAISKLQPFDKGGYGNVFLVRPKKTTDMSIVIKQIQCKDDDGKLRSATCEMLAARLMHFGIVPLWAWAEDTATKTYYIVLPFMENGSLSEHLQGDKRKIDINQKGDLILHKARRLRILYNVACALAFLHKEIPNLRSSYVHRDVTTRNIVLDSAFNARLLDFGLAREYTPGKAGVTLKTSDFAGAPGYFPTDKTKRLMVGADLFNLGTVILEVLSSYPPIYSYHNEQRELREKLQDGHFLEDFDTHIKNVWGDYKIKDKAAIQNKTVSCLINIATKCQLTWLTPKETDAVTSADLKKQLEKLVRDSDDAWKDPQPDQQAKICVICLINEVSPDAQSILGHTERCKLHVCAACMRNSYLNPIECHTCGKEVKPSIGHQWSAVLVAGNDVNNKDTADAFVKDLNKVYKAITSRHPMTMGISKENVHRVYSDEPGTSKKLRSKLMATFNLVANETIHSLLFYFTGHHGHNNGFILGANDEYLTSKDLGTWIEDVVKISDGKRVIILLDCCEAPVMDLKLSCSYYQINSCSMKQNTNIPEGEGSLMTEFLAQSLKGQSSKNHCFLQQKTNRHCDICPEFRSNNGFIKVDQLHENMEKHINKYDQYVGNEKHKLTHYFSGTCWKDAVIAYFIDNMCTFNFSLLYGESSNATREVNQLPELKKDLDEILFAAYREQFKLPKLKPTDFAEMLAITFRTGPRQCNTHELNTVEMIEAAWNGKRELCVSLREIEHLHLGKVGIFMESEGSSTVMECLQSYPECQRLQENLTEVVTTSLVEDGARNLWRYVKEKADKTEVGSILRCLKDHLEDIKDNDNIKDKETLVFTFPLKDDDGKTITSFFSIHVQNGSSKDNEENDFQPVIEIQQYLVSLYNENCQTVPLAPLRPEWREHVEDLYVTPTMVEINPRGVDLEHTTDRAGLFSRDTRESKVTDIRSIFYKGDTLCKDIYLVGEAGSGKTVFCEYLVHLWVKCHSTSSAIVDKNNFMKNFAFLFYISLRDSKSHVVKDMIIDQLENIPHATDIPNLLFDNTWLLILDGLDEYSQKSKSSRFGSQNIPIRPYSFTSNCVTITTSRPWKIELLRKELSLTEHRLICIVGLEENKQEQLVTKVLDLLNREKGRNKSVDDFFKDVTNQKLSKQLESPVLLMQMIGLWFSVKSFGRSQCDIYSNTVEMQLQSIEELKCISVDQSHLTTETETQVQLPACFKDLVRCQKYKSLLLKLSKLANQQLFGKNREATLVFDQGQMEISGINETEITLCLKLGLLTQFKVIGKFTQRRKSVSFVHKSHHEFFAAIYLSQTATDSDLRQILEGLFDLARAMEIEKVFTFVSGMNPSVSCRIAKAIMQHVNLDPRVQQYRASCAYQYAPNEDLVKRIQGVILAGIEEGEKNDVKPQPLQLQDIWMKNDDQDFPPSRIFACKTALDLSHVKSVFIYKPCDISRDEIWRFFKASLPNLQKLVLLDCDISVERVKKVVRRNGGDLQALGLYYGGIDIVDFSRLSQEDLQQILAAPYKSLGLAKVRLTHAQMGFLSLHLSTRSFTELDLGWLDCTEHGTRGECLSLDLTASRDINILELAWLPLQNVAFHPERLVKCLIWDLPETVAADVTRCLRGAEQLEVLWCGGYAASALIELGRTLPSLTDLRHIFLYSADLRGHERLLVFLDQKKLEGITLYRVTLTAEHLRRLLASLPPHRVEVRLGHSGTTVTITGDTTNILKEIRDSPDIGVTNEGEVKASYTVEGFVFHT